MQIPIVFISDENFAMPTTVALTSLIQNKSPKSEYLIYMVLAECPEDVAERMRSLERPDAKIEIVPVTFDKYKDVNQMEHVSIAGLIKFDICDMFPMHDKLLYTDGDVIFRSDLTELYQTELGDRYMAIVRDMEAIKEDQGNAYSGLMLMNAKRIREERMSEKLHEVRRSLGDRRSMDQQTFNLAMNKEYVDLDIKYCVIPAKVLDAPEEYPIEKINRLYHTAYASAQALYDQAVIWHYATSNKPWKYTFQPWAKDWYQYYQISPYRDVPFKLRGRWSYRFHEMKKAFAQDGVSGVVRRLRRHATGAPEETIQQTPWE